MGVEDEFSNKSQERKFQFEFCLGVISTWLDEFFLTKLVFSLSAFRVLLRGNYGFRPLQFSGQVFELTWTPFAE